MSIAENSKSIMGKQENKDILQKVRPENFVRSHDQNAEYVIFRTHYAGTSFLGERYNAGNNYRSKKIRETPYLVDRRHQKFNWTLIKLPKPVSERKEHSQKEKTDKC